jgi:hypothetical protein
VVDFKNKSKKHLSNKKIEIMKRVDYEIIGKKIIVGAIVFLVPLVILAGGLALINQFLK